METKNEEDGGEKIHKKGRKKTHGINWDVETTVKNNITGNHKTSEHRNIRM